MIKNVVIVQFSTSDLIRTEKNTLQTLWENEKTSPGSKQDEIDYHRGLISKLEILDLLERDRLGCICALQSKTTNEEWVQLNKWERKKR